MTKTACSQPCRVAIYVKLDDLFSAESALLHVRHSSAVEKEKAARSWNCAALDVVPGAGIEPARLAAGDFEIESRD
ncbi:hypothetical protein [Alicycliphilus denitrificans]|uniref:hypothetical protein n=1 Tax=Alicycliphilus denitrificans TaxID=179636 RepID=UPI0011D18F9A|nr:hypothetical protein [Alicycliphilus denitrificans]